jgi:hypothetical protein
MKRHIEDLQACTLEMRNANWHYITGVAASITA